MKKTLVNLRHVSLRERNVTFSSPTSYIVQPLFVVDGPFSNYKSKWAKIRKNRERPTRKWVIRLKGVGQYNRNQPLKTITERSEERRVGKEGAVREKGNAG